MRAFWRTTRTALGAAALFLGACGGQVTPNQPEDPIAQLAVNETVQLPELPAATDVVFDELGMPHVFAPDIESAAFVQGYVTAAARFWEMDVVRHFAEGRLSEIFGRLTLNTDVGMRTVFTARDGRRLEEAVWQHYQEIDPEVAGILLAYAGGVNAWLADLRAGRHGVTLPPEYALGIIIDLKAEDLVPWHPQDTLAIGDLQAWLLSETLEYEIGLAQMVQALPDAMARDVFRFAPATHATVLPAGSAAGPVALAKASQVVRPASPPPDALGAIAGALADLRRNNPLGPSRESVGSNNWIVSPQLSAEGHAMLANDPHLDLINPPIWHMIQLDAGSSSGEHTRVNGVNFPGLPSVVSGHNDFGAWGATVAGYDVTDVYVEDVVTPADYPQSPRTVLFNGQRVAVLRVEETFKVKNSAPVTEVIEVVPHHGPMVPDPNLRDGVVGLAATGMSFRWTGHEITNDSHWLLGLNRARNVDDFRSALRSFTKGAQNWVWADTSGNIAYFARALIPQRPKGTVPYLPLSGTGDAEWLTDAQGNTLWLPDDSIPQAINPAEGFLSTANNDQIGTTLDNDPLNDAVYLTDSYDIGFRAERIQELLSNQAHVRPAGAQITLADMSHYQYDFSSKEAARLLPFLFAAAAACPDLVSEEMSDAISRLRAWGAAAPSPYAALSGVDAHDLRPDVAPRPTPVSEEERADAVAMSIFAAWETRLGPAVFDDDFAAYRITSPTGQNATKALLHILEDVGRTDPGFQVHTAGVDGESTLWDDGNTPQVETRDEILLAALRDGLVFLHSKFPSAPTDNWLWGLIHQVRFQHFIGQGGLPLFDLGPFAAPGARYTVSPGTYSLNTDDFTFSFGASQRFVVILDPAGIRAVNALPGGNNGNPGGTVSENYNRINPDVHYGDLIPGWINGQTFEYHISRADVAAHAVRKIRYTP
jgi:penicillin amidase